MLYKPTYCCNCGERIERADWKIFSSRKFCQLCETEYKFEEILPKVAALFLIAFGVWGFSGLFFQSNESVTTAGNFKNAELQKNTKRSLKAENVRSENSGEQDVINLDSDQLPPETPVSKPNNLTENNLASTKPAKVPQKSSDKPVYFCGAETKKGTPCSRRVKGGGRCWQHTGREAILPEKDLLINEQ